MVPNPDLPPEGETPDAGQPANTVKTQGLARAIAKTGRATRRQAEAMIRSGRVRVNGRPVIDPAFPLAPDMAVRIDGELLAAVTRRYYAFHKPSNVVSVHAKRDRRRAMSDFFPTDVVGLRPAGRLDPDTTGLVLVSNDALWNDNATGGAGFEKEYLVRISGAVSELELGVLATGLHLPKLGFVRPLRISVEVADEHVTTLRIIMLDAKSRQIRRLLQALRHEILSLHRVRIGPVDLGDLPAGHLRPLKPEEVEQIRLGRPRRRSGPRRPQAPGLPKPGGGSEFTGGDAAKPPAAANAPFGATTPGADAATAEPAAPAPEVSAVASSRAAAAAPRDVAAAAPPDATAAAPSLAPPEPPPEAPAAVTPPAHAAQVKPGKPPKPPKPPKPAAKRTRATGSRARKPGEP